MIKDLISSAPSTFLSKGDPKDERAHCGVEDLTERACGESERIGSSVVACRGVDGDDPVEFSANSASIEGVASISPGNLALEEDRATPGEKDGGGFTGAASPGDVMDTYCF